MKEGFIYKITNPKGKIYIGQTTRPVEERWAEYAKPSQTKNQKLIHRSIGKYGYENHRFKIVYKFNDLSRIDDFENFFIKFFNSFHYKNVEYGLNLSEFANTPMRGRKHTKESKEKMRIASTGRVKSPEELEKMRINSTGRKMSDDAKLKISNFHKGNKWAQGRKMSESTKQKLREGLKKYNEEKGPYWKGKPMLETTKELLRERNKGNKYRLGNKSSSRKKVISYNTDNTLYMHFDCLKDALLHFGRKPDSTSQLTRCLISGKICYNKFWKYEN